MRVGFFITCLVDVMRPEIAEAAVALLESAGCAVEVPMAQTCCGQPGFNAGDTAAARALARKFLDEFERYDHVVVPSGSCGGMIRTHYPALFADDPDLRSRIDAVASRTWELTAFLHDVVGLKSLPGRFEGEITYHDSCSGLRELGVQRQPRALLALRPDVKLVEMKDARACCGFGGAFAVKYGDISTAIVDEKIDRIRASGAPCVVLGDLGCMLNIEGRLRRIGDTSTRVLHVAQVLAGDAVPGAPASVAAAVPAAAAASTAEAAAPSASSPSPAAPSPAAPSSAAPSSTAPSSAAPSPTAAASATPAPADAAPPPATPPREPGATDAAPASKES